MTRFVEEKTERCYLPPGFSPKLRNCEIGVRELFCCGTVYGTGGVGPMVEIRETLRLTRPSPPGEAGRLIPQEEKPGILYAPS